MKKILKEDLQNIFLEKKEEKKVEMQDGSDVFMDLMKYVTPLKDNKKISNFEYKKLKNINFTKDILNNNNDNFYINSLTRKDLKSIKNNKKNIEATIDLHGETSKNAEILLNNFIQSCYLDNKKLVLVITGKGKNSVDKENNMGILKSMFLNWLDSSIAKKYVVSFSVSNPFHGGEGAYYLILRKNSNF